MDIVTTARTDDYDEIVRVEQLYVDAFNHKEAAKFREAFDESRDGHCWPTAPHRSGRARQTTTADPLPLILPPQRNQSFRGWERRIMPPQAHSYWKHE